MSLDPEYEITYTGFGKIFSGVGYTVDTTIYNVKVLYELIAQSIQTKNATAVQSSVTGPVGIYEVSGYYYNHFGLLGVINLAGTISIGLAIAVSSDSCAGWRIIFICVN